MINIKDFNHFKWIEQTAILNDILNESNEITVSHLPRGLEAEVIRVNSKYGRAVVKIWNQGLSTDVNYQYKLLQVLFDTGVSVSKPYGWGYDEDSNKVLVTSFDGKSVSTVDEQTIKVISGLLVEIHRTSINQLDTSMHRKFDFIDYFFPGLTEHKDIHNILGRLVEQSNMQQDCIIHGDFNLGNILEEQGRFTIIDWTNAQLGDVRYDVAWSGFLMLIYTDEESYRVFIKTYMEMNGFPEEQLKLFEAIACLRWILLNRIVTLPKNYNTLSIINNMLDTNIHLNEISRIYEK